MSRAADDLSDLFFALAVQWRRSGLWVRLMMAVIAVSLLLDAIAFIARGLAFFLP